MTASLTDLHLPKGQYKGAPAKCLPLASPARGIGVRVESRATVEARTLRVSQCLCHLMPYGLLGAVISSDGLG